MEALHWVNKHTLARYKELKELLDLECLNINLRCGEINLLQSQCKQIAWYYTKLEQQLKPSWSLCQDNEPNNKGHIQSIIAQLSALPLGDENIHMYSKICLDMDHTGKTSADNLIKSYIY